MDLKRLSIEYAFEEVKSGVTMEYVDNFFVKLVSCILHQAELTPKGDWFGRLPLGASALEAFP